MNDNEKLKENPELEAAAETINGWGRPLVILGDCPIQGLNGAVYGTDPEGSVRKALSAAGAQGNVLPIIALCDSFGRIYYISKGYNTSLSADLKSIL